MENKSKDDTTKLHWNDDTFYALGFYKRLCSVLGIWPSENRGFSTFKVFAYLTFQLTSVAIFISKFFTYGNCGTLQEIVDAANISFASVQICTKTFIAWTQRKSFRRLLEFTVNDWQSCVLTPESREIMIKYAHFGRILFACQVATGLWTAIPVVLSRLPVTVTIPNEFNNDSMMFKNIPVIPPCWMSVDMLSYLYYPYWIFVTIYSFGASMGTVICNLFVFVFGIHIYGQFICLFLTIKNMNAASTKNNPPSKKMIKELTIRHNHLLNMANDLENASNKILLTEVVAIFIVCCIAGVMLLIGLQKNDTNLIFTMIIRVTLVQTQLLVFCVMGQRLSSVIEDMQHEIYNSQWYELSPSLAKDMQIIMVRSNLPYNLTAGKIYNLNLMNFKEALKSMFSFFSVLRLLIQE